MVFNYNFLKTFFISSYYYVNILLIYHHIHIIYKLLFRELF